MAHLKTGIASIGLAFPSAFISVESLAKLRKVEPDKYTVGLGCKYIGLCLDNHTVVDLAYEAARRALSRWDRPLEDIGLIAIGTESAVDMSRPLSAFVAEKLCLSGAVRSYEVKHACYGGTLALRQALEWKLAGIEPHKAALVIAADVALYEAEHPGEPTQGAGAVAMIIDEANVAEIASKSYVWSKPVFDFWKPLNESYPVVNGSLSLECYKECAKACFKALLADKKLSLDKLFVELETLCFHVPFPKMVKKAFFDVCQTQGWSDEKMEILFKEKIAPSMEWNSLTGNAYTASLWISVARALCGMEEGKKISAFSYGSGCGSELMILTAGPLAAEGKWKNDVREDLEKRTEISGNSYDTMRNKNQL